MWWSVTLIIILTHEQGDWQPLLFYKQPRLQWISLGFFNRNLRGIGENWWRHSRESGRSNLVCGILSRIQWLNDCDVLQTPEGGALVTDAKESLDSIPAWLRTDRWIAVSWQGALNISTERMGGNHWQRWNPCIQLVMERSKKDWMKTVGKQRDGRDKASPFAYLKFSPMNYISISIFIFMF